MRLLISSTILLILSEYATSVPSGEGLDRGDTDDDCHRLVLTDSNGLNNLTLVEGIEK